MKATFVLLFPAYEENAVGEFDFVDEIFLYKSIEIPFHPFIGLKLAFDLNYTRAYENLAHEKHLITGIFKIEEALCAFNSEGGIEAMKFTSTALYDGSAVAEGEILHSVTERDEAVLEAIYGYGFKKPEDYSV